MAKGEVTIDWTAANRELSRVSNRLRAATGKTAKQTLHDQARLFIRDCAKMTPPFGPHSITESWSKQRKLGEVATEADIRRVFRLLDAQSLSKYFEATPKRKEGFIKRVTAYARRRNIAALERIVTSIGYPCQGVIAEVDPALHKKERFLRGRVPRKGVKVWLVLSSQSLKRYIRDVVGHVGKAKAGWAKAAAKFGVSLPRWITRHKETSPGLAQDDTDNPTQPSVTIGNLVDFAQEFEGRFGIVKAALRNRERAMRIQTDKLLAAAARKL